MRNTHSPRVTRSDRTVLVVFGVLLCGALLASLGCKDLTGTPGLPAGTPNPSIYNTAAGAIGLRNAAIVNLDLALPQYFVDAGLLSDELQDKETGASTGTLLQNNGAVGDALDERILPEGIAGNLNGGASYVDLQNIRGSANLALHALAAYDTAAADTATQHVLRGELYAVEGYAEILLADLFCSGVPLSTLDFQGDFTYAPSSTTAQVYHDALAKLDSARLVGAASDSVVNFARVLQGRAYLDLGQYDLAAAAVASVPDGFHYTYTFANGDGNWLNNTATVSDREGENGLPFRSGGDPRTADTVTCPPNTSQLSCPADTLTFPIKYSVVQTSAGYTPVVVADWVEARLIRAEAALAAGDPGTWLMQLNFLRANALVPGQTNTLASLSDPGSDTARIALLFRERAAWLFVTGHRQGDLRRLLRQYSQYAHFQSEEQVYPIGTYLAPGTGRYGTDVTAPIPSTETANPAFHGCLDRNP